MQPPATPESPRWRTVIPLRADDHAALASLCRELRIDLVVVGPEAPLVAGLADELRHRGIAVFGPSAAAAQIEGSKSFAKDVLDAAGVPTARTLAVAQPPCVVKLDGLAAGKGVWVCHHPGRARRGAARRPRRSTSRSTSRSCSKARSCRSSRSQPATPRSCSRPHATTSGSATATPARTPAEWARSRRCPTSPDARGAGDPRGRPPAGPPRARAARHAVPRVPLRRPDAHRRTACA